ncbi:MAG: cytochrome c oxidase assembly protein [Acidobacteria bacterium]|nr:cytochrome c oxidase assembly protein [Acidobacteriota bacterium]
MELATQLVLHSLAGFVQTAAVWARTGANDQRSGWTWPPYIVVPLLASALVYLLGLLKMRRHGSRVDVLPTFCFVAGWTSLVLALDSPLHEASEHWFWVHMTQHEILILVSAPLLVLGRPLVPLLWALPECWRGPVAELGRSRVFKRGWLLISAPLSAWLVHAAAIWLWHAPALFIAALDSEFMHAAQHLSFLGSALIFWWALIENHTGRLGHGGAVLYVFTTAIHTSVLGALLTFAPRVWYAPYEIRLAGHLTALEDQQIGGLIMWIPAGTLLTVIGLLLLIKSLTESERRWQYTRTAAMIRTAGGDGS